MFISAKIFEWLRLLQYHYYEIFLITAALYTFGVIVITFLIRAYEEKEKIKSSAVLPISDELTMD